MIRKIEFSKRALRTAAVTGAGVLAAATLGAALAPAASAAPTAASATCRTADLGVQLKPGSPGAGQRFATVVLTNTSAHACTVQGYGGLALLGAPGQGVPTDLRRVTTPAPAPVRLQPGQSARSGLQWTVVPADDEPGTACEPTATTVVVTPPDQDTAALRPWSFGPVCQHGQIHQNAYVPGSAAL